MCHYIYMKAILSDISALNQIRDARCRGVSIIPVPLPLEDEIVTGVRQLDRLGAGDLASIQSPAHLIVPPGVRRTRSKRIIQMEWGLASTRKRREPNSASCFEVRKDLLALTPEACALSLARTWPAGWIALLLDEFCGGYSLTPGGDAFIETPPVCNLDSIREFARNMSGQHGIKRLSAAIELAGNDAASPFESQVHVWLCQDIKRGGFGIPQPLLNATVYLGNGYGGGTSGTQCKPDLYWPDKRFGVECDGAQHNNPYRSEQDALRSVRLANAGIHEARISAKAFHSLNAACDFGTSVRAELGLPELSVPRHTHTDLWKSLVQSPWDHVPLRQR
jgi:hypothetical protein